MPCSECNCYLERKVYDYSVQEFRVPLCRDHQEWLIKMEYKSTWEAISLYFALKARGVAANLEKFDGYKTIDIAVPHAMVNIEVDGAQHNFNPRQALSDLQRTYYSFLKGYLTLRIPNSLIRNNLDETAALLAEILRLSKTRKETKSNEAPKSGFKRKSIHR